jgi:hypothetical protein
MAYNVTFFRCIIRTWEEHGEDYVSQYWNPRNEGYANLACLAYH